MSHSRAFMRHPLAQPQKHPHSEASLGWGGSGWRGRSGVSAALVRSLWQCGAGYAELSPREEVFRLDFREEAASQSVSLELKWDPLAAVWRSPGPQGLHHGAFQGS